MRYYEIYGQLPTYISMEEEEFIKKLEGTVISEDDLDERDQEVARKLTSRGVIDRFYVEDTAKYRELCKAVRL